MSEPVLRVEKKNGIATLTLNRPRARNALSRELRGALARSFLEVADDGETGVVILTGAPPAFCAGLDLKELGGETEAPAGVGTALATGDPVAAMEACPHPIIGAVNGVAITGGFEIALACDLLVASREARFADTHARVGILPGWGLSQKLPRLIGIHRAKELSLTGNFLSAADAAAWGLVSRVVEPEALLPACEALARDVLGCVPEAVRGYKRLIDDGFALPYAESRRLENERNREQTAGVTPEAIRARRAGIQARGRTQRGD